MRVEFREWLSPPRRLLALFVTVTVAPAAALIWLGWRLLQLDRALESQRAQERLELVADRVVDALSRRLEALEKNPPENLPAGIVLVVFTPAGVESRPPGRLLYLPAAPRILDPPPETFLQAEVLEFQRNDCSKAADLYRARTASKDPAIRAGALVRLARCLRKSGARTQALDAYRQLEQLGSTPVGGVPAQLVALHARCNTLEELKDEEGVRRTGAVLAAGLNGGRWALDRPSFEFHAREARRWTGASCDKTGIALSSGVEALWAEWQEQRKRAGETRARRTLAASDELLLAVWRASVERLEGYVATAGYVESQWQAAWKNLGVSAALVDSDGRVFLGQGPAQSKPRVVRSAIDTGLPWTLRITSTNAGQDTASAATRRRLIFAGLGLMMGVLVISSYFVWRAVGRELAIARLQSEFVSAVSHEFRTPLTTMRHLTELLDQGAVTAEERRRTYYSVLSRETERLRRLVEGLLNFARTEAGIVQYRFQRVDLVEMVREVVEEFRGENAVGQDRVGLATRGGMTTVRADKEALSCAVWNLLDNALKYSPEDSRILVEAGGEGNRAAVRVEDRGPGIPAGEREEIFRKFVRGSAARMANVRGTGIGLAVARHVVRAHGGEIRLTSELGRGSAFTIRLPLAEK